ncbi:hypothetical protein ABZX95_38050 [Streptomyces sp. NPDC004232]|uniref:hypothetical protein n=1 Tax=Streptomyces sp. NPDC004232 TaxID=3154454 RepID=UPI0033B62C51
MTTVDQILFGWAERDHEGNAGVRPVAHSGLRTIDRWAKRLQYVWATQDGQGDQPEASASLVHLVFEDEAAVLRKLPSRNPHGRGGATLTHVLVGDPRAIDSRLALGLHDWPGWQDREPDGTRAALAPLDLAGLEQAARPGLAALREEAAGVPADQLTTLVARVLADPAEDFSVIARPQLALPMMTALLDIVGPVAGRPWTFAGRESTDKGSHQPRVVFLAARPPQSMYINQRLRVDVTEPPPASETARFAAQLVELYRTAGHPALERIRPRRPLTDAVDVTAWRRSVPIVDGRIADPRPGPDVFLDDVLLEQAAARGALVSGQAELAGELRRQPADWLAAALRRWRRLEQRAIRRHELRDLLVSEAVEACLAGGPDALVYATADAEPPAPTVAAAFLRHVPDGGLDLSGAAHRRLLVVALHLGLPAGTLHHGGLLAASPADELLDFVARHAEHFPDAAHLVLRHLADAGHGPDTARLWYGHGLLLGPVDRIAAGDRAKETDCFRHLLIAAHGPRLDRTAARELVERAGVQAPLGLYAAALELAADDAAQQPIRHELSEQFLRDHGYAGPVTGSTAASAYGTRPRGPVTGGPAAHTPPAAPAASTARPAPAPATRPQPYATQAGTHTHTEWAHPVAADAAHPTQRVDPDPAHWDTPVPPGQTAHGPGDPRTGTGPPSPAGDGGRRGLDRLGLDGVTVFFLGALVLILVGALGYVLLNSML